MSVYQANEEATGEVNAVLQIMKTGDVDFLRRQLACAISMNENDGQPFPAYYTELEKKLMNGSPMDVLYCILVHIQGNPLFRYYVRQSTLPALWDAFQARLKLAFESLITGRNVLPEGNSEIITAAGLVFHMTRFVLKDCYTLHPLTLTNV